MTEPAIPASPSPHTVARPGPWGETLTRRRITFVLVSVMLGMLLSALDQTIVGTALPRIIADLNGLQHYAWVATGYLLASAASMPIWGKLSDAYGRRRFFLVGMVVFVLGSLLCGQSRNMTELITFRAIQGLGAGAITPIAQAILGDIFPPAQRARWTGYLMSVFGLATILGPLLCGWITDSIGWRWVFYVNLPIGIIACLCAAVALPGHVTVRKHVIDYSGSALLVAAVVPLLLAFSLVGNPYGWGSPVIIGLFVFAVVMGFVFVQREMRAAEPVLNPSLFRNRIFAVSTVAGSLQYAGMYAAILYLPLFVQGVMGKTAVSSGIVLTPLMIGAIITSIGAGQLLARTGRYKAVVIVGFAITVAGTFLLYRMGVATTQTTLVRDMVIMGLGLGVGLSSFTVIVQNQYPVHRLGEVTAGLQFFRTIGATVGLAVFGTILNTRFSSSLHQLLPSRVSQALGGNAAKLDNPQALLSAQSRTQLLALFNKAGSQGQQLFNSFMDAVRHSLQIGMSDLFLVATIIGAVAFVIVLFLKEVRLRRTYLTEEGDAHEVQVAPSPGEED